MVQGRLSNQPLDLYVNQVENETIICRCERVTAGEIRSLIQSGKTDVNEIKALCRAGMGACGGKTCFSLINRIFREEGVPVEKTTTSTNRPIFMEVSLSKLAGMKDD